MKEKREQLRKLQEKKQRKQHLESLRAELTKQLEELNERVTFLKNAAYYEQKDVDPRYWFARETATVDKIIKLPADASGDCTLYLNLPDPAANLHDNPLFSIRLANAKVWDEETGYNKIAEIAL